MSLTPIVYRSTDPGAPTVSGSIGAFVGLLDAVLVNGYGAGPTAKPGAGWTIAYTATNKRAYRNSPATGTGFYLRVDDTAAINNAQTALVRAYSAMSDIDTGFDQTPPAADVPNGVLVPKSGQVSAAVRPWVIVATERWAYVFISHYGTYTDQLNNVPLFVGDIDSRKPGDLGNFMVSYNNIASLTGLAAPQAMAFNLGFHPFNTPNTAFRVGALVHGVVSGAPTWCGLVSDSYVAERGDVLGSTSYVTYPDPVTGGLILDRPLVIEGAGIIRGNYPNLYSTLHQRPFSNGAIITDVEGFPGVSFLALTIPHRLLNVNANGLILLDITSESLG